MTLGKHWIEPIWFVMSRRQDEDPQIEYGPIFNCAVALLKMQELQDRDIYGTEYTIADIRFRSDLLGEELEWTRSNYSSTAE